MATKIRILSICGSGVVTSSMVASKLRDMFAERGYDAETVEANSSEVESYCTRQHFDMIAYASPIGNNFGVPAFNAIGLITGMGEEEFMEEAIEALHKAGK
ncbi:PTS fructose transporter subunit IIB [Caproiciproducens galactitolivorans]|uniref:Galactitol-specific phosphotransferase enzyme IIB component n=1 Tax=Caproiciproducens galactitolivorans TaxID=642589 RepID=A0A4Z0XWH8_9FIRM|nr:PTS fructose transporter subunit IIB [Caproiciproducens galactitolivorans]QEY34724.1 PTS fructose transporter subunit IIB [Caproiciproducens galactitolivorans]TGJ75799.1 galactitol-specific phosphotransferase enzyme IIB component [Caproiciproducens galactitolivorans]